MESTKTQGDGKRKDLSTVISNIAEESVNREKEGALWRSRTQKAIIIAIVAVIAASTLQFGINFASNEMSKEAHVNNNNAALVDKSGRVVKTRSSEMAVGVDGLLMTADKENAQPIKVEQQQYEADFSDYDRVRNLDVEKLEDVISLVIPYEDEVEVFKISGFKIIHAGNPKERKVVFSTQIGSTIEFSKDGVAVTSKDGGRRLAARRLDDKAAAVAKTAAIKNIQKALTARILKR